MIVVQQSDISDILNDSIGFYDLVYQIKDTTGRNRWFLTSIVKMISFPFLINRHSFD